jgi:hypothetical protein
MEKVQLPLFAKLIFRDKKKSTAKVLPKFTGPLVPCNRLPVIELHGYSIKSVEAIQLVLRAGQKKEVI